MKKSILFLTTLILMVCSMVFCYACGIQPAPQDPSTENLPSVKFSIVYSVDSLDKGVISCTTSNGDSIKSGDKVLEGETVTFIATANEGYEFVGWFSGEEKVCDKAEYSFKLVSDVDIKACFKLKSYTLTFLPENNEQGTITANNSIVSGANVEYGASVTLTATANEGYEFIGWFKENSQTAESTDAEYTFVMPSKNLTVVAKFSVQSYKLNYSVNDSTKGEVSCQIESGVSVEYGTSVTLIATANEGYSFIGWFKENSQTALSTDAQYTFQMPANELTLVGKFTAQSFSFGYSADSEKGEVECEFSSGDTVEFGTSVTLIATAKEGYSFAGWYKSGEFITSNAEYTFVMPLNNLNLEARFEKLTYSLTCVFDSSKGEVNCSETNLNNIPFKTLVTLTVTEKTGYDFVGWFKGNSQTAESTDAEYEFEMPANSLTLEAKFVPEKRYVYFNDGYDRLYTATVDYDTTVSMYVATKDNYTFNGWFVSPADDAERFDASTKIKENINLYAKWTEIVVTHDVIFVDDQGGQIGGVQEIEHNSLILSKPAAPEKVGYEFTGWYYYDEASKEDKKLEDATTVIADMTIRATYSINKYLIYFYNESTATEEDLHFSYEVDYNNKVVRPSTPTKTDYLFVKWVYLNNVDVDFNFDTAITDEVKLVAVWTEKPADICTVKFYDGEGEGRVLLDTQTVEEGATAIAPSVPEKEGKVFDKWNTSLENITADVEIWAIYKDKTFEVTFKDYNGNVLKVLVDLEEKEQQTVIYGQSAILPQQPVREGYDFAGWSKDYSSIKEDLIITATYTIKTYTVTFRHEDGEIITTVDNVAYGSGVSVPATPSKAGYSFVGWCQDSQLNTVYNFNTPIISNTDVYAKFEKIVEKTYTVRFVLSDGTVISVQSVIEGRSAIVPSNPTSEGYNFVGWDKTFDNITSNIDVNAIFEAIEYDVKFFDINGVQIGQTQKVAFNTTAKSVEPTAPTIVGKTFIGWDKDVESYKIKGNTSFYAKYASETRTVTFYVDGEVYSTIEVEYGSKVNIPNTPAKAGWLFNYWYFNQTQFMFDTMIVTDDLELHAKFTQLENVYTVTFLGADKNVWGNVQVVVKGGYAMEPAPYQDGTQNTYIWCLQGSEQKFDFDETQINGNVTLVAIKEPVTEN